MKKLLLFFIIVLGLSANIVKSPVVSVDGNSATIKIDKIDVGMSGFVVHKLDKNHSTILKSVVVESFDKKTKIASLVISDYNMLDNSALPSGNWSVKVGDTVILAFGYKRGFLVAPNDDIYYKIIKSAKDVEWIHPDIFAMILSTNGHLTPLKSDFKMMSDTVSVGIFFFYLNQKLFTVDAKSFKILNISDAPLVQKNVQLPFYTRIQEIDSDWWGAGSSKIDDYETYYYELLVEYNKNNKELYSIIKQGDTKLHDLLNDFEL